MLPWHDPSVVDEQLFLFSFDAAKPVGGASDTSFSLSTLLNIAFFKSFIGTGFTTIEDFCACFTGAYSCDFTIVKDACGGFDALLLILRNDGSTQ